MASWFERTFGSLGAADAEADRREPMPDEIGATLPLDSSAAPSEPSALDGGNADTAKAFPPSSALRIEDSLESMIRTLTGIADANLPLPPHMVRDVRDLLILIRKKELEDRGVITPQSIHADHHLRLVT